MNNSANLSDDQNGGKVPLLSEYIPASSHYALKLAFQTLKERCDKLQIKLSLIAEENMKLKESNKKKECSENSNPALDVMEKKLDELSRQKSQLSHHIFILANENKTLWDNISKLTKEKDLLLSQLKDHDSKLNSLEKKENKPELSTCYSKDIEISVEVSDEECTLLEKSSKNKKSLENIETENHSPLNDDDRLGLDLLGISDQLKDIINKLNEDKTILKQQQAGLKKALEIMKKIYQGMKVYALYLQHLKTDEEESSLKESDVINNSNTGQLLHDLAEMSLTCQQLVGEIKNNNEVLCPICNKLIVYDAQEKDFKEHFLHHVRDCSENDLVLKSFEIIEK